MLNYADVCIYPCNERYCTEWSMQRCCGITIWLCCGKIVLSKEAAFGKQSEHMNKKNDLRKCFYNTKHGPKDKAQHETSSY